MNDNAIRVISYLVRSHVAWNSRNHETQVGIIHKRYLINKAILKMMKD